MTTTYYSAQVTLYRANTMGPSPSCGPCQCQYFSYTTPTGDLASGSLLMWGIMPKGARFLGGKCVYTAGGHAATANIGSYTIAPAPVVISAAKYGALTSMVAAGHQDFGELATTGFGGLETADVYMGIVTGGAQFDAAGTIAGYFLYLL